MIHLNNIVKKYNNQIVINNFSFSINDGEITLILGKNGAGKTTTINCILNLVEYNGKVEIDGVSNKFQDYKSNIGYIPENPMPFDYLTVWEHIEFIAKSHKMSNWKDRANSLVGKYGLLEYKDKIGKELSHGMKQKLNIVTAILYNPNNLIFDEPIVGLDPRAIDVLKHEIIGLKNEGKAIIISTHMIDVFSDIWDRAIIIDCGKIISDVYRDEFNGELTELFLKMVK